MYISKKYELVQLLACIHSVINKSCWVTYLRLFYLWMLLYYSHKGIRAGSAPLLYSFSAINKSCWVTFLCLFISAIVLQSQGYMSWLSSSPQFILSLTSRVGSPFYVYLSLDAIYQSHKGIRASSAPLPLNYVINKSCRVTYLCLFISGCYCTRATKV